MKLVLAGDRVELANGDPDFSPGLVLAADTLAVRVKWDSGRTELLYYDRGHPNARYLLKLLKPSKVFL